MGTLLGARRRGRELRVIRPAGRASGTSSPHAPEAWTAGSAETRSIAVVSDASALHHHSRRPHAASVHPLLRDCAHLIRRLTGLRVLPLVVDADDSEQLSTRLRELPGEVRAVYLTHAEPARARAAHAAGDVPVLTEQDATAVAVTAALLVVLDRLERAPAASQVVIAGAATMPLLPHLVMAAGVGDIIRWNPADRTGFPLRWVTEHADVLIDLIGGAQDIARAAADRPHLAVIAADGPTAPLLPVPGLLLALASAGSPALTLDVYLAGALALAAATPPDRRLPDLSDPHLTRAVADPVIHLLDHPGSSAHRSSPTSAAGGTEAGLATQPVAWSP